MWLAGRDPEEQREGVQRSLGWAWPQVQLESHGTRALESCYGGRGRGRERERERERGGEREREREREREIFYHNICMILQHCLIYVMCLLVLYQLCGVFVGHLLNRVHC